MCVCWDEGFGCCRVDLTGGGGGGYVFRKGTGSVDVGVGVGLVGTCGDGFYEVEVQLARDVLSWVVE